MTSEVPLDESIVNEPVCAHLRNKGMYITGERDPGGAAELHAGHCWCNLTQYVFGPDSELVERPRCVAGRTCYEAVL